MDVRTGKPVVASWARTHEFQPSFSHEKTKHVFFVEEEETHDRTGTPVVCPQRGASLQRTSFGLILGGDQGNLAPGSLSTGSPAGRTLLLLKRRDGSMYSQAYVRPGVW